MAEIRNEEYKRKFYGLCNDYMFHLVLQKCTRALTYLVAALQHKAVIKEMMKSVS